MEKLYRYGMRLRGYSMGTQPRGVVKWEDADKSKDGYWSFIYYSERLDDELADSYDLDYLGDTSLFGAMGSGFSGTHLSKRGDK